MKNFTRLAAIASAAVIALIAFAAPASAAPPAERTVTIRVGGGQGTVTVNGVAEAWVPVNGSMHFAARTTVPTDYTGYLTVTATPAPGYQFAGTAAENGVGNDTGGWAGGSSRVRSSLINTTTIVERAATAQFQIDAYHVNLQALFTPIQAAPLPVVLPPLAPEGEPTIRYIEGETIVIVEPRPAGGGATSGGTGVVGGGTGSGSTGAIVPPTVMPDGETESLPADVADAPAAELPLPITGGDDLPLPITGAANGELLEATPADPRAARPAGLIAAITLLVATPLVGAIGWQRSVKMRQRRA